MNIHTFFNSTTISTYLVVSVCSAAISSMPIPADNASEWYKWVYKFLNAVMANVSAIRGKAAFDAPVQPQMIADSKEGK